MVLDTYPLTLINEHKHAMDVWSKSDDFLATEKSVASAFSRHIWAFRAIQDLVPQTLENFGSGHYFPYTEAYSDLESSFELAKLGFYKQALGAVRSALELGLLGTYFAERDQAHIDVQPWINSDAPTPNRRKLLNRLNKIEHFDEFDRVFDLVGRIHGTLGELDRYVHTRGTRHSAWTLSKSNVNTFSERLCGNIFVSPRTR